MVVMFLLNEIYLVKDDKKIYYDSEKVQGSETNPKTKIKCT